LGKLEVDEVQFMEEEKDGKGRQSVDDRKAVTTSTRRHSSGIGCFCCVPFAEKGNCGGVEGGDSAATGSGGSGGSDGRGNISRIMTWRKKISRKGNFDMRKKRTGLTGALAEEWFGNPFMHRDGSPSLIAVAIASTSFVHTFAIWPHKLSTLTFRPITHTHAGMARLCVPSLRTLAKGFGSARSIDSEFTPSFVAGPLLKLPSTLV
jgi:hypothetical protein